MMKRLLFIVGLVGACTLTGRAQDTILVADSTLWALQEDSLMMDSTALDSMDVVLIIDEMPHAIVHQDSLITELMLAKRLNLGEKTVSGFRLQIYASNRQQQAKKEATELYQQMKDLLEMDVYIISELPFWKVRIGNFETREKANEYKTLFLQQFPELISSTYVVPDKIILRK